MSEKKHTPDYSKYTEKVNGLTILDKQRNVFGIAIPMLAQKNDLAAYILKNMTGISESLDDFEHLLRENAELRKQNEEMLAMLKHILVFGVDPGMEREAEILSGRIESLISRIEGTNDNNKES